MNLQDIKKMVQGDLVRYVGQEKRGVALTKGKIYFVEDVDTEFRSFKLSNGLIIGHAPVFKEWDVSSFELIQGPFKKEPADWASMLDFAVLTDDREWFFELHAKAFPSN